MWFVISNAFSRIQAFFVMVPDCSSAEKCIKLLFYKLQSYLWTRPEYKDVQMHGSLLDELYLHKDSASVYLCFTNLYTLVLFIIFHSMDPSETRCASYFSDMETFTRQEEGIHSWNCDTYEGKYMVLSKIYSFKY